MGSDTAARGEALRLWDQGYYLSVPIPVVQPRGYTSGEDFGGDYWRALLWYADGTVRFRHTCATVEIDGVQRDKVIAPALTVPGHVVSGSEHAPTVNPSILCPDCGTHGFIEQGRWRSA
jgi:hypothetical protein